MLVLSRKIGEEVIIDDCIRVKVIEVRGKRVRLGIEAPEFIAIVRGELTASQDEESIEVEACSSIKQRRSVMHQTAAS